MTSDHFASHLDETPASTAHADRLTDERPPESPTSDAVDETSQHAAAQQKRRLPKWLWVTGTIAIFVVGGVGYKSGPARVMRIHRWRKACRPRALTRQMPDQRCLAARAA